MTARRETFRRYERIGRKKDFERILSARQVIRSRLFDLFFTYGNGPFRQIGMIVSRKTARKSTERTKIKRRFREIFRKNKETLPAGIQLVLRVKAPASQCTYAELQAQFLKLVGRIKQKERK